MNTLLDQIRDIVKSVKDDKEKLQQIVNYLESEIIEEEEKLEESNNAVDELPDKYKPIVNEIAQYIDMGMLCFLNPEKNELNFVVGTERYTQNRSRRSA